MSNQRQPYIKRPGSIGICLCLVLSTAAAEAAYLDGFVGNTRAISADGLLDITANWAVLERDENPADGDVFGVGLPGFDTLSEGAIDTDSRYLYLFQIVNDGSTTEEFRNLFLGAASEHVSSFSTWNLMMSDDDGRIGPSNQFGTDGAPFEVEAPANVGVESPDVARRDQFLRAITLDTFSGQLNGAFAAGGLQVGETSLLIGYTSDMAPAFPTELNPARNFAAGYIPIPTPEPATGLLMVLASLCGGMTRRV